MLYDCVTYNLECVYTVWFFKKFRIIEICCFFLLNLDPKMPRYNALLV